MCWKCGNNTNSIQIFRTTTCPSCGSDLHSCYNCKFYSSGSHYDCKETNADLVTDKEFERSKVQLKSSIKMGLESSSSTAEVLARQNLIYGKSLSIREIIEKIDAVTKESIRDVADKIFKTNPTYTLLGAIDKHMEYDELQKALA